MQICFGTIPNLRISREWRQKIECWLQANEQDEKQNEEYRRKMRRVTSNRRSLETDTGTCFDTFPFLVALTDNLITESEKGSKLDPLPEEKSNNSPTRAQPAPTSVPAEPYRRVYPEWKPSSTLDKTDVVGTMEALAGMACKFCTFFRKTNNKNK